MKKRFLQTARYIVGGILLLGLSACSTPKKVAYFQDLTEAVMPVPQAIQTKVEPSDKLSIIVKSKDPKLVNLFNLTLPGDRVGDGYSQFTVSREGTIDFPVLGTLKVAGMTRDELAAFIKGELMGRELIKDPVVTVEFLSAGFSVLGEVNRPGKFQFNKDNITLLEALSMAGDLGIQGQRENIAIVRHEKDGVHTYRVDLTNFSELVKSPAYYVRQDDVIYVEPNGVKKRQTTVNGNNIVSASFWVSIASLLTTVAVLVFK
ncbi:MAG: polysaccharide export protein [Muribaculaceae bacterium]|nr:polysaccharide export protein [Muribaculaceae bacterium]MDE6768281.1 polysaccharide export protein [Muribaculaceae bacterium]